jgi:hypothetical protein
MLCGVGRPLPGSPHSDVSSCVPDACACCPAATQAVIYAATCDWDADKRTKKDGSPLLPHEDLRYYARGVFSWPQVRMLLPLALGSGDSRGLAAVCQQAGAGFAVSLCWKQLCYGPAYLLSVCLLTEHTPAAVLLPAAVQ